MADLRYPVGKFEPQQAITDAQRDSLITQIAEAPRKLREAVRGLSEAQLNTPYRDGGWTVTQVVHHVGDSHLNAYVRFKLAVTEREPTVKSYEESLWAGLPDARTAPVGTSLALLDALHERWVLFLRALTPDDFRRNFRHPEHGLRDLDYLLQLYGWHGRHHVAHITSLRDRMGWRQS